MTEELLLECSRYIKNIGIPKKTGIGKMRIPRFKIPDGSMMEINPDDAAFYLEENRGRLFTDLLFSFIDRTGRTDSEIYKKAMIDRRLFSKIRSNKTYTPSKKTVIALCLALELTREESDRLLSSAGYSLSRAQDYDLIIAFCIERKLFDFFDINEMLEYFGYEPF